MQLPPDAKSLWSKVSPSVLGSAFLLFIIFQFLKDFGFGPTPKTDPNIYALIHEQNRMLSELTLGYAPRDPTTFAPMWTVIRQEMRAQDREQVRIIEQLIRELNKNTAAMRGLGFELEDSSHRAPIREPQREAKAESFIDRFFGWMNEG
jgi:hypothetical protein